MLTFLGVLLILVAIAKIVWSNLIKSRKAQNEAIRKRNEARGEYQSEENLKDEISNFPIGGKILYWFVAGAVVLMMNGVFFWAEAGTAYSVQYPWGGDKMIKTQGLKVKWWGRVIPLSYEISLKDVKVVRVNNGDEWVDEALPENGDGIYNRKAKQWEFSDAIKANIEVAVVIGVSTDDEQTFLKMADRNRSEAKLINGRVLPNIDAALKNTCKLMDAQDYISGKASDFDRYFRDQLENGMYQVEEYYEDENVEESEIIGDSTTTRMINPSRKSSKAKKYKIKKDRQGNIMRDNNSNTLTQYGIKIYQAQVTGIDWEKSFDTRLDKQKDEVAKTQLEKQEAERQFYTAKKEIAKGEAQKAMERAKLEKEQIKLTIAAETKAKVAEQNVIVEKRQLEVEKYKAQSKKVAADATYYENLKRVQAGLTPQERLKGEIQMNFDKWSQLKSLVLPTTYIGGTSNGKSNSLLEQLIGANLATRMLK